MAVIEAVVACGSHQSAVQSKSSLVSNVAWSKSSLVQYCSLVSRVVLKCRCCHRYLGHNIIGVDLTVDDKCQIRMNYGKDLGTDLEISRW